MWYPKRRSILTIVGLTAFLTSTPVKAGKRIPLNRSIYVPVEFRLCEHLKNGVLYIGEQAVAHLPAERIFQFTYYPALDRIAPEVVYVRIEAFDLEGNPIVARLAVTTAKITTAHESINLDFAKHVKKLSYKIDTHYDKVNLLIRCGHWCGAGADAGTNPNTQAGEDGPKQPANDGKQGVN